MNNTSAYSTNLDQTGEDFLIYTVSDEALEAAAGTESEQAFSISTIQLFICC